MSFDALQAAVASPSPWAFGLAWLAGLLVLLSALSLPAISAVVGAVASADGRKG